MIKIPSIPIFSRTTKTDIPTSPRSESVRQRRQQRISKPGEHILRRTRKPVYAPPITLRENRFGRPIITRTRIPQRRQFAIPFGAAGSEVVLPALPVIHPGWRILSGMMTLILGALIFLLWNYDYFQVSAIRTEGLKRIKPTDLENQVRLAGLPIVGIDPKELQTKIEEKFPELYNIIIKVDFPARVVLQAKERQPALAWKVKDRMLWIDKEGFIFPARGDGGPLMTIEAGEEPPGLQTAGPQKEATPLSAAPAPMPKSNQRKMDLVMLNAALKLSAQLPPDTTLVYHPKNGIGWTDKRGWNAYLGSDLENIGEKMNVYQSITSQLEKAGIKPGLVSVEQIHAPFYRMER